MITALTGSAMMTPYELQSLSGEHKGVSIHVAHDVIANQTAKRGNVSTEESYFSNTTTWKLFNETGKEYQKAYSRKPILNKQTQLVELDRIYEDTDTETVALKYQHWKHGSSLNLKKANDHNKKRPSRYTPNLSPEADSLQDTQTDHTVTTHLNEG